MTEKSYNVWFETDFGVEQISVQAASVAQVHNILRNKYPEDIGADGVITDPDGNDYPIDW